MSIRDLFNSLSPELQVWAEYWIAEGSLDPPYVDEPSIVTAKLRTFRLAYNRASEEEIYDLHRFISEN